MSDANMLGDQPNVQVWTRDGFNGAVSAVIRPTYSPEFISVQGAHAPRRAILDRMTPRDQTDSEALPTVVATSRLGLRLLVSGRRKTMTFAVRNVEADEIHFIQRGEVKFETDAGTVTANEGDFVCIPRAVGYRYGPTGDSMRSVIVESPWPLKLNPPSPIGMINFGQDVHFAKVEPLTSPGGKTKLLLKSEGGEVTTYVVPNDPLAVAAHVGGAIPVWKLNLSKIQCATYLPSGGPPSQFLSSPNGELCMFNLSARITNRAPIHVNADYDEVVLYAGGPGAWGGCNEPGTLTWVPKGVLHHGPAENVSEGYSAWLIETKATLRWTPEAIQDSELMETGEYSRHPSAGS